MVGGVGKCPSKDDVSVSYKSSGPQPRWRDKRCSHTAKDESALDKAFVLIEGAHALRLESLG